MKREFIILLSSLMLIGLLGTASMSQEAGKWTQKADMPTARFLAGSAVVDGKIYTIGGRVGRAGAILSTVEEFDPGLPGVISSVSPEGKLLETWGQMKLTINIARELCWNRSP